MNARSPAESDRIRKLRAAVGAAAERADTAHAVTREAWREEQDAMKAHKQARAELAAALAAEEFELTHPPLFGGQDQDQGGN